MFTWLGNVWRVPELRRRLLFTAGVLAVYRFGSWVPTPGVNEATIQGFFNHSAALNFNAGRLVIIILTLTAGTTLLMWMGEQITKRGVGNGISLLIFASILAYAPQGLSGWINGDTSARLFFPLVAIGIVVAVVFVMEGQRRIPIQYARRQLGNRQTSGGSTYMPLSVVMAGVIPIIFAAAILAVPQTVGTFEVSWNNWIQANFGYSGWKY